MDLPLSLSFSLSLSISLSLHIVHILMCQTPTLLPPVLPFPLSCGGEGVCQTWTSPPPSLPPRPMFVMFLFDFLEPRGNSVCVWRETVLHPVNLLKYVWVCVGVCVFVCFEFRNLFLQKHKPSRPALPGSSHTHTHTHTHPMSVRLENRCE